MGGVQVGRGGGVSAQSMGEMGKDFCQNFIQPFLENIDSECRSSKYNATIVARAITPKPAEILQFL